MAEIQTGLDGSFTVQEDSIEQAKVEAASRELEQEQAEGEESLILGKFKGVDELTKAYQSLQAEFTKSRQGKQEPETEAAPDPEPAEPVAEPQKAQAPSVTQQQVQQAQAAALEQVGGLEKYQVIAQWANNTLDAEAKDAFNAAVNSGNVYQALTAVKSLQFDYQQANGLESKLISGRPAEPKSKGFQSEAQVVAAMSDPRYQNGAEHDPAYVEEVAKLLSISPVFAQR